MNHPPLKIDPDLCATLDVPVLIASMSSALSEAGDGKVTRTLIKDRTLTVVLVVLEAGARLAEHAAPGALLVIPLQGRVCFTIPARDEQAELTAAQLLTLGPRLRHEVVAIEEAAFLLVIGARGDESSQ